MPPERPASDINGDPPNSRSDQSDSERRYGIAGRAAGEAALEHGRDGARIRSCQDALVISRIARAIVDALDVAASDEQEGQRVRDLREDAKAGIRAWAEKRAEVVRLRQALRVVVEEAIRDPNPHSSAWLIPAGAMGLARARLAPDEGERER